MKNEDKEINYLSSGKCAAFEKTLHIGFIVVFMMLIMVQAAIFFPSLKPAVIENNARIGVPIGKEEFLYKEGSMVLTLVNFEKYPALKVLVNGIEKASFENNTVDISICDGDVIELDGSGTNANSTVKVSLKTPAGTDDITGKTYVVGKEVMKILKVRLS